MIRSKGVAALLAGAGLIAGASATLAQEIFENAPIEAQASAPTIPPAEKLKKLKILLMVSALRCRRGADDFRPAYERFAARHLPTLRNAHMTMKAELVARHGASRGQRELDRAIVSMANEYGQGHPWMDCSELAQATADLADFGGDGELLAAADLLLGDKPVVLQPVEAEPIIAVSAVDAPTADTAPIIAAR